MPPPYARASRSRPIADFLAPCLGKALAAQGFAGSEIIVRWPEIAGAELARRSEPLRLSWPRGSGEGARAPGTLLVRVESAYALELQLQTPILLERINRYFGWACVGTIRLKQGSVARRDRVAPPRAAADPALEAQLAATVRGVEDARLADALVRLGRAVASGASARS